MLTLLHPADASGLATFRISHQEMIKGIRRGGTGSTLSYDSTLEIPIIENTCNEEDLTDGMARAMEKFPEAGAVLVRRHGVYVWGGSWEQAKTQAECLDYLFEIAVSLVCVWMRRIGADLGL
jgi:methylthioribulose-1-phosphate dehydratase